MKNKMMIYINFEDKTENMKNFQNQYLSCHHLLNTQLTIYRTAKSLKMQIILLLHSSLKKVNISKCFKSLFYKKLSFL